jgi:hypothetical protein
MRFQRAACAVTAAAFALIAGLVLAGCATIDPKNPWFLAPCSACIGCVWAATEYRPTPDEREYFFGEGEGE